MGLKKIYRHLISTDYRGIAKRIKKAQKSRKK